MQKRIDGRFLILFWLAVFFGLFFPQQLEFCVNLFAYSGWLLYVEIQRFFYNGFLGFCDCVGYLLKPIFS